MAAVDPNKYIESIKAIGKAIIKVIYELFKLIPDWVNTVIIYMIFILAIILLVWLIKNREEWKNRIY